GNRAVLAALGHVDAEAASVQGARAGESQRHLHHEDLASLMSLKDKAAARLPQSEDMGPVIDELSKIANVNKLKISKMQNVALSDKEKLELADTYYGIQRLDVELEGNYVGFYKFLTDMEKQPRIIRIQNLDIQRINEGDRQGDVKVRMDLRVYYGKAKADQAVKK
ncbi:MAG TPA: type 4a pilus biogenesis protein PilO, partial [Phycisphaerae bacterium]|nr:type 4a pilus biogenesis protein PilO [Phycisphaerae bacterium]